MITKDKKGPYIVFTFALIICLTMFSGRAHAAELQDGDNEKDCSAVIVQEESITDAMNENTDGTDEGDLEESLQKEAEEEVSDNPEMEDAQNEDSEAEEDAVAAEDSEAGEDAVAAEDSEAEEDAVVTEDSKAGEDAVAAEDFDAEEAAITTGVSDGVDETDAAEESEMEENLRYPASSSMSEKEQTEEEPKSFVPFVRPIKDGTYVILSKIDGFMALQTEGASNDAGKPIEVQNCNGSNTQKFKLISDAATGYYSITNLQSGKNLAVKRDAAKIGTAIVQNTVSASLGQKWILVEKDGYYMLQSALDGSPLALTLKGSSTRYGTDVILEEAKETASQLFSFLISKPSVTIKEGVYEISSALDDTMRLDIAGGSMADKGNLQIYKSNGTPAQRFIVEKAGNNQYTITSYHSGKTIDVNNGSTAARTNVQQYTKNGTSAQKWLIRNVGDGTIYFTSTKSWLPLEVQNGKTANRTNVFVNTATGSAAQKFHLNRVSEDKLIPIEEGVYLLNSAKNTNRVIGVEDASRLQKANIQLQYNANASFQKFRFIYAGNGYYKIQNVKSKHMLDLKDGSYANKTNIRQWNDNGTVAQRWLPHKNPDGSYSFINAKSSRVIDAAGGSTADSANLWAYSFNNTAAQKFKLTKTSGYDGTAVNYGFVKEDPVLSEMYKKAQDYNSNTNYLILCNITKHRLVLFKKNEGRWLSDMTTPVTVGSAAHPTPTGTFEVYNHWDYFDGDYNASQLTYQCWWSTCFYGPYYFHSIIYKYNTGYPGIVKDGTLGANRSHGCVRQPLEKAKYLYDHSPIGTKVRVYK